MTTTQADKAPPATTWLTVIEAAAEMRVSDSTIVRWFKAAHLPGWKQGSVYRISASFMRDLKAVTEAGEQVTVSVFASQWRAARTPELSVVPAPALAVTA